MQQKKQDIVEEARAIIQAFENRGRKKVRTKALRLSRFFPLFYGALGFLSAALLAIVLRVSLFR